MEHFIQRNYITFVYDDYTFREFFAIFWSTESPTKRPTSKEGRKR